MCFSLAHYFNQDRWDRSRNLDQQVWKNFEPSMHGSSWIWKILFNCFPLNIRHDWVFKALLSATISSLLVSVQFHYQYSGMWFVHGNSKSLFWIEIMLGRVLNPVAHSLISWGLDEWPFTTTRWSLVRNPPDVNFFKSMACHTLSRAWTIPKQTTDSSRYNYTAVFQICVTYCNERPMLSPASWIRSTDWFHEDAIFFRDSGISKDFSRSA